MMTKIAIPTPMTAHILFSKSIRGCLLTGGRGHAEGLPRRKSANGVADIVFCFRAARRASRTAAILVFVTVARKLSVGESRIRTEANIGRGACTEHVLKSTFLHLQYLLRRQGGRRARTCTTPSIRSCD